MIAYMIYEREEGKKNEGFIRLFEKAGREYGISFLFVSKEEHRDKGLPDIVLNRTRDCEVSLWYEERGIPVFHSARLVSLGNDKWKTYCYLKENIRGHEISLAETMFLPEYTQKGFWEHVVRTGWQKGCDLILKSVDGHGGEEVFLLPADAIWEKGKKKLPDFPVLNGRDCIVQERIKSHAKDIRVYVIGNKIYHAMLRTGKEDFRSNHSLGGSAESYVLSESERKFIEQYLNIFSELEPGMCGLDFIVTDEGKLIFNELEEMVGCRMLYQYTEKDIVKDYVRYLYHLTKE